LATLEKELAHRCVFQTRSEAYDAISDHSEAGGMVASTIYRKIRRLWATLSIRN
jgi:hypothetical protein